MTGRRLVFVLAVAGALLAACGRDGSVQGSNDTGVIRFSVLSAGSARAADQGWSPIIKDMEASTGLTVKPIFAGSGAALIEAMGSRKTDFGWFSNQSGLEAVRRANGEVFARTVDPPGMGDYTSVLIVNAASKLTLDKVLKCDRTLTFAMGDGLSISRTLAPETYLFAPRGVDPATCFKQVRRAASQTSLHDVVTGQVDLATDDSASLMLARKQGWPEADALRVIWRSPVLPEDPIIWRRDLDPAIKEKLRQFFLTYGQGDTAVAAAQRAKLLAINTGGFKPADDSNLLPVREMEAMRAWLEARAGGDKAKIDTAKTSLDAITAERESLEARTRAPAAAQ